MTEAMKALLEYKQHDEEGIIVLASRQAIHEVSDENERMRGALKLSWELSTWAGCINWRARDKDNTGEWLDDLHEKIESVQESIKELEGERK